MNNLDYAMIRNSLSGATLNHHQTKAGDVVEDATINAFDAFYIDKTINNLII